MFPENSIALLLYQYVLKPPYSSGTSDDGVLDSRDLPGFHRTRTASHCDLRDVLLEATNSATNQSLVEI
jgi:hypothetical protein